MVLKDTTLLALTRGLAACESNSDMAKADVMITNDKMMSKGQLPASSLLRETPLLRGGVFASNRPLFTFNSTSPLDFRHLPSLGPRPRRVLPPRLDSLT